MRTKHRTGTVIKINDKRFIARISYTDASGKRKYVSQSAATRSGAKALIPELMTEYQYLGDSRVRLETFDELADYYKQNFLIAPKYAAGRKVRGSRSWEHLRYQLERIRPYFAGCLLREITHGDLERYRNERLCTPIKFKRSVRERGITGVNRDLGMLRRMFAIAVGRGWMKRNPFEAGEPLISVADEDKRTRILTKDEESRLLLACKDPRTCLKDAVVILLDCGARTGELFKALWSDVDFENRVITLRATNTKTLRERQVPITRRAEAALRSQLNKVHKRKRRQEYILPVACLKKAWGRATRDAGLPGVRLNDLRHTCATRLVDSQMELPMVGKILGHTQPQTTYRYVNAHAGTVARAAELLDKFNEAAEKEATVN